MPTQRISDDPKVIAATAAVAKAQERLKEKRTALTLALAQRKSALKQTKVKQSKASQPKATKAKRTLAKEKKAAASVVQDYEQDKWITRTWSTDQKVYSATLKRDLFGDWVVFRFWAGKKQVNGHTSTECVGSYEAGLARINEIATRRVERGYVEELLSVVEP